MLIKTIVGVGLFATVGAAVGYSKILCVGGECQMTGTPYGGALVGGMLGLAIMSGLNNTTAQPPSEETTEPDASEERAGKGGQAH